MTPNVSLRLKVREGYSERLQRSVVSYAFCHCIGHVSYHEAHMATKDFVYARHNLIAQISEPYAI